MISSTKKKREKEVGVKEVGEKEVG